MTRPFINFDDAAIEIWQWISIFIPYCACDYLSLLGLKLIQVRKRGPRSKVIHANSRVSGITLL